MDKRITSRNRVLKLSPSSHPYAMRAKILNPALSEGTKYNLG